MGAKSVPKIPFSKTLLQWDSACNQREMPWKFEKDPYKIWLSEIILQQTRVAQGISYYNHFTQQYPTLKDLAKASDNQVFKSWEGLGYYSRCRNMLHTARFIAKELQGKFPTTFEDILSLKGIGPYTAAAIASFSLNLPYAVVDGNVIRVISRVFGLEISTQHTQGKKQMGLFAQELLDKNQPAKYNQAIMDFGATVCTPTSPSCSICPFRNACVAFQEDKIETLPVKIKKAAKKKRYFNYIIAKYQGKIYIRERVEKDIWRHLHEFILLETNLPISPADVMKTPAVKKWFGKAFRIIEVSEPMKQELTHQQIHGRFIVADLATPLNHPEYRPCDPEEILQKAFPKMLRDTLLSIGITAR